MLPYDLGKIAFDKKGRDILLLDLRNEKSAFEYMLFIDSYAETHSRSIVAALSSFQKPIRIDGHGDGEWIVLDYGETLVHIFVPGVRSRYQLESIWPDAKICDVI